MHTVHRSPSAASAFTAAGAEMPVGLPARARGVRLTRRLTRRLTPLATDGDVVEVVQRLGGAELGALRWGGGGAGGMAPSAAVAPRLLLHLQPHLQNGVGTHHYTPVGQHQ
eukprot:5162506-Pyramimonas_sp.AAC.1